uniref:Ion_trans_2 domain-containing protein n=1 Tax=Steinernema glaseri TaxID=37863 RepID=A0A1I7YZ50_9BILA
MSIAELFRNRPQVSGAFAQAVRPLRRFYPVFLLVALVLYVLLGTVAFISFESSNHENTVRKWKVNQGVNRRQRARLISTSIFNDTKNLLIIIDRDQTDRVQGLLVNSLSKYEEYLDVHGPKSGEWDVLHSLNYAWSLLMTIGHGIRGPETTGGQIFAFFYSIIGVPFFFGTIGLFVHKMLLPLIRFKVEQTKKKLLLLLFAAIFYVVWLLLLAFYLHSFSLPNSFWKALYTATLTALTIQTPYFNQLSDCSTFALLAGCTMSITLALFILLLLVGFYGGQSCENRPVIMKDEADSPKSNDPPKFTVIVDEAGDSKLADMDEE